MTAPSSSLAYFRHFIQKVNRFFCHHMPLDYPGAFFFEVRRDEIKNFVCSVIA
jgi:hypothetical protein